MKPLFCTILVRANFPGMFWNHFPAVIRESGRTQANCTDGLATKFLVPVGKSVLAGANAHETCRLRRGLSAVFLSWSISLLALGAEPATPSPTDAAMEVLIRQFEDGLAQGRFPNADLRLVWWQANRDPFVAMLAGYSKLHNDVVVAILGAKTEGEELLPQVAAAFERLAYWSSLYTATDTLTRSAPDSRSQSYLRRVLKFIADQVRSTVIGAARNLGVVIIEYSLNQYGQRAVDLSNQSWWKAYQEFQIREHPDDKQWVDMIVRDNGFTSVETQLDRFWTEYEDFNKDSFVRTNNPDCVRDYRLKFLREKIMPALRIWAAGERAVARNAIKHALLSEAEKLRTASVQIDGQVRNYLADFSETPVKYRVELGFGTNKKVCEDGREYRFIVPLREMQDGRFSVSIQPVGQWQRWEVPAGGGWVQLGRPLSSPPGMRISVKRNADVVIDMPLIRIAAIGGQPSRSGLPPGKVDVPPPPSDGVPAIEARGRAVLASYGNRTTPWVVAMAEVKLSLAELDAERERQSRGEQAIERAITRNSEVDRATLLANNRGQAANEVTRVAAGKIKEARERAADRASRAGQLATAWQAWLRQQEEALRQRDRELAARLKAIEDEMRLAEKDGEEGEREMRRLLETVDKLITTSSGTATEHDDFDPLSPERLRGEHSDAPPDYAIAEQRYLDLLGTTRDQFDGAYQRMLALEERMRALLERYQAVNRDMAAQRKQQTGLDDSDFPFGAGPGGPLVSESALQNWNERLETLERLRQSKADQQVKQDLTNTITQVRRRQPRFTEYREKLRRLEELLRSPTFPTTEQMQTLSASYDALLELTLPYLAALGRGVRSSDAGVAMPAGVTDPSGSDAAFVRRQAAALRSWISRNWPLCADLLSGSEHGSTELGNALSLVAALQTRQQLASREERARFIALRRNVQGIAAARWLPEIDRLPRTWQFLEPLGRKPAERIQAMIAGNRSRMEALQRIAQTITALPRLANGLPPAKRQEIVQQVSAAVAAADTGTDLPLECRTVELHTAHAVVMQAAVATGALTAQRMQDNLPLPPKSALIDGRPVPLDGRVVLLKFAELSPGQRENLRQIKIIVPAESWLRAEASLQSIGKSGFDAMYVDKATTVVGWTKPPGGPGLFLLSVRTLGPGGVPSTIPGDPARLLFVVEP